MPLGSPETLDTFSLGGFKLTSQAPEEMREAVSAAFRFFFFKKGPTIVQKGRVTPEPITLVFKFNGDEALSTARTLKRMAMQQQEIPLSWARQFSFKGYLTNFDFTYRQQEVTGALVYQPVEDLANKDVAKLNAISPAQRAQDIQENLQTTYEAKASLALSLADLKAAVADWFQPVTDAIQAIEDATSAVNDIFTTVGDIAALPFQLISEIVFSINTAIGTLTGARDDITTKILAPVTPLLEGTADFLARSTALDALVYLDDLEISLSNLAGAMAPVPVEYSVQEGDTLEWVATLFSTTIADLLQMNPGLSAETLAPGVKVKVPHG
jgi:hypothetical protein